MKHVPVQFLKFAVVGVSNTLIAYGVYALCIFLGLPYLIANAIGFFISVLNAYYWSDRFVFKKGEGETRQPLQTLLKTYLAYGSTGLVLASFLLYIFVDKWHISAYLAQILTLAVTVPLNFIINKFWSFKTKTVYEENQYSNPVL